MDSSRWDVVVIGAGAAGMMAAMHAAERGRRTLLLEKNRRPGVKILMSGGTRCNLTHATDNRGIVEAFGAAGKFLHSALAAFGVQDTLDFFARAGVATKVEDTGKIFPASDKAADVLAALVGGLRHSGAALALNEPVLDLRRGEAGFALTTSARTLQTERVILTTGGRSYPGCGTTGDGYGFVSALGHALVTPRPALVPLTVAVPWVAALRGLTLPDVAARFLQHGGDAAPHKDAVLASRRGALLFTHFGLSGPVVLDLSRVLDARHPPDQVLLELDLLPGVRAPDLDELLRRAALAEGKKLLVSILPEALPRRLGEALVTQAGMPVERKAAGLSRGERSRVVEVVKRLRLPITGTLGFAKAEVTAGGVPLDEVDSRSLRSLRVPGLYLAGELLDVDGPIGGYNFQAAFSTGWLAGNSV